MNANQSPSISVNEQQPDAYTEQLQRGQKIAPLKEAYIKVLQREHQVFFDLGIVSVTAEEKLYYWLSLDADQLAVELRRQREIRSDPANAHLFVSADTPHGHSYSLFSSTTGNSK